MSVWRQGPLWLKWKTAGMEGRGRDQNTPEASEPKCPSRVLGVVRKPERTKVPSLSSAVRRRVGF